MEPTISIARLITILPVFVNGTYRILITGNPHQILRIGSAGDQTAVIRNEFGVHPGFLTDIHHTFQIIIILQGKCDRDFIQLVLRKDVFQITKRSQYFHSLIGRAARDVLIQNTTHYISPLGIAEDSVNIFLRRPGITYQQNMLQIVSFFRMERNALRMMIRNTEVRKTFRT